MNTAFLQLVQDNKLAQDLSLIIADFEILDFFKHFGSSCFAMSAILAQILTIKGYQARVQGCYAEIRKDQGIFYIGYQGFAHAGQKEGHAVCIVADQYLLDFGLGTLRKFYAPDFSQVLVCPMSGGTDYAAHLRLADGADICWRTDWISPMVAAELQSQIPSVQNILAIYDDFQKNRVAYLVKKLFADKAQATDTDIPLVMRQPQAA
ncbi:hypothetical protein ACO0LF_16885 [Undibacterium sp. Di27W]|uniref:hypothetical protein n=1 Tax=Undibacterium sp. Di27W TaxID=3413036 RepID=UPI003BF101EC